MPYPFKRALCKSDFSEAAESVTALSGQIGRSRELADGALVLAWLSDFHIHAPIDYPEAQIEDQFRTEVDSAANVRVALAEVAAMKPAPDVLVLGGDLIDHGRLDDLAAAEYAELATILKEALPAGIEVVPILGNHDLPLTCLPAAIAATENHYVRQIGGWRFVALDSGSTGPLESRQREWLSDILAEPDAPPTIVLVHRPIIEVGNLVDSLRLVDPDALKAIRSAPTVRAVFSGHAHKPAARRVGDQVHVAFGAVSYGIGAPPGWGCAVLSRGDDPVIFTKELHGLTYDRLADETVRRPGRCEPLAPTD